MKFLESIFKFSNLLTGKLKEGIKSNLAIFSSSSTEMDHFVMDYGSKALENSCESFLKFPYLLVMGIILEKIYDLIKVGQKCFSVFGNWYILQFSAGSLEAEHLLLFMTSLWMKTIKQ